MRMPRQPKQPPLVPHNRRRTAAIFRALEDALGPAYASFYRKTKCDACAADNLYREVLTALPHILTGLAYRNRYCEYHMFKSPVYIGKEDVPF
jgi:hypothetical protein